MVDSNLLRFLAKQNPFKATGQSHAYLDVEDNENTSSGSKRSDGEQQQRAWLYQMHQHRQPPLFRPQLAILHL
jgi:hypothetical protein